MKNKLMTHSEVKEMLFKKDSKFKKAYDELAPRYELISKAIDARLKSKMTQEEVAKKNGNY